MTFNALNKWVYGKLALFTKLILRSSIENSTNIVFKGQKCLALALS